MRPSVNTWHNHIIYILKGDSAQTWWRGGRGKYRNLKMTLQWALTEPSEKH